MKTGVDEREGEMRWPKVGGLYDGSGGSCGSWMEIVYGESNSRDQLG